MKHYELLEHCTLCPRDCSVNRNQGEKGYCRQTSEIMAARAALHMWEEPSISGTKGSGTVFFSGCSLQCVYCQNRDIALGNAGKPVSPERLTDIFLELQDKEAHNINLVTPTHFVPQIAQSLEDAKAKGLTIPVVYNTSSYEKPETLRLLDGLVDIYLPDFKYISSDISKQYSNAADYAAVAKAALLEMYRQTGPFAMDYITGLLRKGMIVRHLLLPGCMEDSKQIISYLYHTYGNNIFISIMNQYTPMQSFPMHPGLSRRISDAEYENVVDHAVRTGIINGYIQEGETAWESFIPPFDYEGLE